MAIRDVVGPKSLTQIIYVGLLWLAAILGVCQLYETSLLRLELVLGTGIVLSWMV